MLLSGSGSNQPVSGFGWSGGRRRGEKGCIVLYVF